jgi:hypothetical protein
MPKTVGAVNYIDTLQGESDNYIDGVWLATGSSRTERRCAQAPI